MEVSAFAKTVHTEFFEVNTYLLAKISALVETRIDRHHLSFSRSKCCYFSGNSDSRLVAAFLSLYKIEVN